MTVDKFEKRRTRLLQIRRDFCGGSSAELAGRINRAPTIVSRMLMPPGKTGKKNITEGMRDIIEQAFSLPKYWMDGESPPTNCGSKSEIMPLFCALNEDQKAVVLTLVKTLILSNGGKLEPVKPPAEQTKEQKH